MSNDDWIIEAGDSINQRLAVSGWEALSPRDQLLYCLWVADYGIRNAGDLAGGEQLLPGFQSLAHGLASQLELPVTAAAFSLPPQELEASYYDRFDAVCDELRLR